MASYSGLEAVAAYVSVQFVWIPPPKCHKFFVQFSENLPGLLKSIMETMLLGESQDIPQRVAHVPTHMFPRTYIRIYTKYICFLKRW